jgi:uroporphyrinogen III methyltransferase/synthase
VALRPLHGLVYLIGAGPGDPLLITVRGQQCLAAADVVLYDHLVHARLLRYARPDAEKIDVGGAAPQPLEQEAICYLLAEKAREGKTIARLKWGDPFIFDNGGSEALFLHEQGVRFEVVPGIPAGMGAAAYAGIPLTYPGGGKTLTFIRGYDDEGRTRSSIDWKTIARLDGALVCYSGPEQLPVIIGALLSHGRPADDPAALIFNGTLPTQETRVGTLEELARAVVETPDRRAAVLVTGRVAAFREHLRWFDARPLFGKRVLVTRPREQAGELAELLEGLGAEPILAPLIRIVAPNDYGPLDEACAAIDRYTWIIFASANAVDAFMGRLAAAGLDLRALKGVKVCAVGTATAARLAAVGFRVDLIPREFRAEAVVSALVDAGAVHGGKFLLPRADIGREVIAEELRARGAQVDEVVAYRTVIAEPEREDEPDVYRMMLDHRIDVVTFTSPSAVRNFVNVFGAEQSADLLRSTVVASIGPVTAEAATQHNIATTVMPREYTTAALAQAIVEYFSVEHV